MRAAEARRDLIAEARCYRLTRSVAFVRAWAFEDSPDDPVAAAQSAYMLSSMRSRGLGSNLRTRRVDAQ
jgi:acyl-coenzyme A thioesterase PaaI-like protein